MGTLRESCEINTSYPLCTSKLKEKHWHEF